LVSGRPRALVSTILTFLEYPTRPFDLSNTFSTCFTESSVPRLSKALNLRSTGLGGSVKVAEGGIKRGFSTTVAGVKVELRFSLLPLCSTALMAEKQWVEEHDGERLTVPFYIWIDRSLWIPPATFTLSVDSSLSSSEATPGI